MGVGIVYAFRILTGQSTYGVCLYGDAVLMECVCV